MNSSNAWSVKRLSDIVDMSSQDIASTYLLQYLEFFFCKSEYVFFIHIAWRAGKRFFLLIEYCHHIHTIIQLFSYSTCEASSITTITVSVLSNYFNTILCQYRRNSNGHSLCNNYWQGALRFFLSG